MTIKDDDNDDGIFDDNEDDDDAPPKPEGGGRPEQREEDSGDDEADDSRVVVQPEKPSRSEQRRGRGRTHIKEMISGAVNEALARQAERHEQTLAAVAGNTRTPEPSQPAKDPLEDEIDLIKREQQVIIREFNALPAAEQQAKLSEYESRLQKAKDSEADKRVELKLRQRERSAYEAQEAERQARENNPFLRRMRSTYADVYGDAATRKRAGEIYFERRQSEPASEALYEATLQQARAEKSRKAARGGDGGGPSANERARLSGVPRGGSDRGGGSGQLTITKEEASMATAMYPGIPKDQAVAKWVKNVKDKAEKRRKAERA